MFLNYCTSMTAGYNTVIIRSSNFVVPTVTNTVLYDIVSYIEITGYYPLSFRFHQNFHQIN